MKVLRVDNQTLFLITSKISSDYTWETAFGPGFFFILIFCFKQFEMKTFFASMILQNEMLFKFTFLNKNAIVFVIV